MSLSHWGIFPGVLWHRQFGWITITHWRPLSFEFWVASNLSVQAGDAPEPADQLTGDP
jgi:hypothetical protein